MTESEKDRRHFRRYRKETDLFLKVDQESYECKTVDYSPEGICIHFLQKPPSLLPGKVIEIKIETPDLELFAEAVWTKEAEQGLIAGFKRVGNIKGTCEDFRLPDLLIGMQRSTKTGVFHITTNSRQTKIYFQNGDMVFASSNYEDDRFGEVLLKKGSITLEQLFKARNKYKETGKRMGNILIELGYLKSSDLAWAVRYQVEEIIVNLLSVACGHFEFKEGPLPSEETITLKLSAANLICRGVKRINSLEYILQDFPPMESILSLSGDPLNLFQDLALDEGDQEILSTIQGTNTVREILSHYSENNFETIKTLYALLSARIIDIKSEDEAPSGVSHEDIINKPLAEVDPEFVKMVDDTYELCKRGGYYEILGVQKSSPQSELKRRYFKLAKEFHPDRHFSLNSEDVKQKLNEIFSSVTEAYTHLSHAELRKEYDEKSVSRPESTAKEPASNTDRAKERFEEGRSKMGSGLYIEAEQLFAQALYLDSSVANYHYYQGLAFMKQDRYKEAARALENAIKMNPENAYYFSELGYIFLKLGFQKRAEGNFKKALEISPSHEKALKGLEKVQA